MVFTKSDAPLPMKVRNGSLTAFIASEIVREKLDAIHRRRATLLSNTVEIERFDYNLNSDGFHINALILVERTGQKKMVIGKRARKIKTIGREARIDMEELFGHGVYWAG